MALAEPTEGWRVKPAYTVSQAAHLATTTPATARRWLYGYDQPGHQMQPVFGPKDRTALVAATSFLELAELVVAVRFRRRGLTLDRVRRAHRFAAERFGLRFPFATLRMRTDGRHVLHEYEEEEPGVRLLALDLSGQWALPNLVVESLDSFDFEGAWAARWFPAGTRVPIVIDPRMGAGNPTVVGRGVTVRAVYMRWKAGQSIPFIASDYRLPRETIEEVLRFGDKLAA